MKTPLGKARFMLRWTARRQAAMCLSTMIAGAGLSLVLILADILGATLPFSALYPTNLATIVVLAATCARAVLIRRWAGVSVQEVGDLGCFLRSAKEIQEALCDDKQAALLRLSRDQGFVAWSQLAEIAKPYPIEWMFVGRGGDTLAGADNWQQVCTEKALLDAFSEQVSRTQPMRRL